MGWLKLGSDGGGPYLNTAAANWGVNRDKEGNLWGYAWSEGWGWVRFNPPYGGVSVHPVTGAFSGYAWAENYGWISFRSELEAKYPYGVGLLSYTLNLIFTGTGSGVVSSTSPAFSCNTNCQQTVLEVTPLKLSATASPFSLFDIWQGCETATGSDCNLTLDQDRTTTVTYNKDTEHVARIDGSPPAYYPSLQAAYSDARTDSTIETWGLPLNEALNCRIGKSVVISGGYDQFYQNRKGSTIILGLIIGGGKVTADRIVIMTGIVVEKGSLTVEDVVIR